LHDPLAINQTKMHKYLEYVKEFQADNEACKHFVNNQLVNHLKDNPENQTEIEHILDYLYSTNKTFTVGYKTIKEKADKWNKKLQSTTAKDKEEEGADYKVVKKWEKGFKMVKLLSKSAYELEGKRMSHCVSSYYGRDDEIYSLRDKDNKPHATLSKSSQQIKGKGNGCIHPKYIKYVVEFLEYLEINVRDSEMLNLGYMNLEKFKKHLHKDNKLFKGKYWYIQDGYPKDKKGNEFASLDFLDQIPLISETQAGLKMNFELKSFINLSFSYIWNQNHKLLDATNASAGDFAKNTSAGYYAMNSSAGNYATNASAGRSATNASSGDYATNASTGDSAKNSSSGEYATNASAGRYATTASAGNFAKNSSSGYSAKNSSSGTSAKNASAGNSATNEMLGLDSVSVDAGHNGKAKGKAGCWFCLSEWKQIKDIWKPLHVEAFFIDGKKIKEDTWYTLKNKKLTEWNPLSDYHNSKSRLKI